MVTIQLKRNASGATFNISAVYVRPRHEVDDERYIAINRKRKQVVDAYWKKWEIKFGYLSEAFQQFLDTLESSNEVTFTYQSTTYNVEVDRVNPLPIGGSIILINREPEA